MFKIERNPEFRDDAPTEDALTAYGEGHLITYLRLLDAQAEGADWQEVMRRDPAIDPIRAKRCWRSHLDRGVWMTERDYRHILARGAA